MSLPNEIVKMIYGSDDDRSVAADWFEERGDIERARIVRAGGTAQLWLDKTCVFRRAVVAKVSNGVADWELDGDLDVPHIASVGIIAWTSARLVMLDRVITGTAPRALRVDVPTRSYDLRALPERGTIKVQCRTARMTMG